MFEIDANTTIGELVKQRPGRSRVFEELGIDYCCGGKRPLAEACRDKGLDPATVVRMIGASEKVAASDRGDDAPDWARASLSSLCDHIETTHHAYLKRELPRLSAMVQKVAAVHGARHGELHEVAAVFESLAAEMSQHMMKEERVLFPMIRQLELASHKPDFHCGSIANPIHMMEREHDGAGSALKRIRQLMDDYAVPADACNTFRAMIDGLTRLETDMHQHVHKENNILFPRTVSLEDALSG